MVCPICKRTFEHPAPPAKGFGVFCSDRCQLVDLGRWLSGTYQIESRDTDDEDLDESVQPMTPPPGRSAR